MSDNNEQDNSESRDTIQITLKDLFGEEIAKKFAGNALKICLYLQFAVPPKNGA